MRRLIPRMPDFVARHPEIAPEVISSVAAPSNPTESSDVAVRRGLEGWPEGLRVTPFVEDEALVVVSPVLLQGIGRMKAAGRLNLDHLHMTLQAAVDGLGIAVAPRCLWGSQAGAARAPASGARPSPQTLLLPHFAGRFHRGARFREMTKSGAAPLSRGLRHRSVSACQKRGVFPVKDGS